LGAVSSQRPLTGITRWMVRSPVHSDWVALLLPSRFHATKRPLVMRRAETTKWNCCCYYRYCLPRPPRGMETTRNNILIAPPWSSSTGHQEMEANVRTLFREGKVNAHHVPRVGKNTAASSGVRQRLHHRYLQPCVPGSHFVLLGGVGLRRVGRYEDNGRGRGGSSDPSGLGCIVSPHTRKL